MKAYNIISRRWFVTGRGFVAVTKAAGSILAGVDVGLLLAVTMGVMITGVK